MPAAGAAASLRFTAASAKAWQEKKATVAVAVRPAGARCTLTVRYADGSKQRGLAARKAVGGKARWTWTVPATADAGPAKLTVWCKGVGKRTRTMVVIGTTAVQAKLNLRESGWTQRPDKTGPGSSVSYGIVLENPDVTYDAVGVNLLVNFLNAEGRIIGSKTHGVAGVAAGSEYLAGGWTLLRTQIPVTRLEIVVTTSKRAPRSLHFPAVTALAIEPSAFDKGWVGAVRGELVKRAPAADALARACLHDRAGLRRRDPRREHGLRLGLAPARNTSALEGNLGLEVDPDRAGRLDTGDDRADLDRAGGLIRPGEPMVPPVPPPSAAFRWVG